MAMSQVDVASLKEALSAQEQLIEKLYNELDEESEASASAASEALAMILRLQGEKAAEEMEAEQYKRFVEEKMCHAEESLSILEDLIDQKEMEIADLDYQAQVYRDKLLSMGYDDLEAADIEIPENLFHMRNENLDAKMSRQGIGRVKSAPDIPLKYANQKKCILEKDECTSPDSHLMNEQQCQSEKKFEFSTTGSINSYCEQIQKLEERVKQIAEASNANLCSSEMRYRLPLSQRSSTNNFLDGYLVKHRGNKSENETCVSSVSPPNVLDVFEVPKAINTGSPPKDEDKMILHSDERHVKPDIASKEAVKPIAKDETDWLKKSLVPKQHENKLHRVGEAASLDCHLAICPTKNASETTEFHRLNRTFEIAEVERQGTRQESKRQEELMLLHEIKEQIDLMQSEIRSWKINKSPPRYEPSVVSLTEVMVCFWL